jgi:hypothetical protein
MCGCGTILRPALRSQDADYGGPSKISAPKPAHTRLDRLARSTPDMLNPTSYLIGSGLRSRQASAISESLLRLHLERAVPSPASHVCPLHVANFNRSTSRAWRMIVLSHAPCIVARRGRAGSRPGAETCPLCSSCPAALYFLMAVARAEAMAGSTGQSGIEHSGGARGGDDPRWIAVVGGRHCPAKIDESRLVGDEGEPEAGEMAVRRFQDALANEGVMSPRSSHAARRS